MSDLTLDQYARVKAILRHFGAPARAQALAAVGLVESEWNAAERHWRNTVDAQLATGESAGAEAFEQALRKTRSVLSKNKPALDELAAHGLVLERAPTPVVHPPVVQKEPAVFSPAVTPPVIVVPSAPADATSTDVDTTAPLGIRLSLDDPDPLPFKGANAAPESAVENEPPSEDVGETVALGMAALQVDDDALPFEPAPLTLEQYASLHAELRAYPGQAESIYSRYGLADPQERANVEQYHQQRLKAAPERAERYGQLLQNFLKYLSKQ